jgi:serine/threonine protein kinase
MTMGVGTQSYFAPGVLPLLFTRNEDVSSYITCSMCICKSCMLLLSIVHTLKVLSGVESVDVNFWCFLFISEILDEDAPGYHDSQCPEKCDIWDIGIVVYILLSARHPFYSRNNPFLTNQRILTGMHLAPPKISSTFATTEIFYSLFSVSSSSTRLINDCYLTCIFGFGVFLQENMTWLIAKSGTLLVLMLKISFATP